MYRVDTATRAGLYFGMKGAGISISGSTPRGGQQ